jgi:DNA-binding MarR family transcriptional regulator
MRSRAKPAGAPRGRTPERVDDDLIRRLAWFRYSLRQFLRFSERAARDCGVTPQQHQLLLGIAGYTGREWATIGELAEFLQERHNAVVGLVERAAGRGLVRKMHGATDRRFVRVHLTAKGESVLARLSHLHEAERARLAARMFAENRTRPRTIKPVKGA